VFGVVYQALCSLLKRDITSNIKAKGNPLVSVLICNVLMTAFLDEENWPESFVKVGSSNIYINFMLHDDFQMHSFNGISAFQELCNEICIL